ARNGGQHLLARTNCASEIFLNQIEFRADSAEWIEFPLKSRNFALEVSRDRRFTLRWGGFGFLNQTGLRSLDGKDAGKMSQFNRQVKQQRPHSTNSATRSALREGMKLM